jgi:hypothetical protein
MPDNSNTGGGAFWSEVGEKALDPLRKYRFSFSLDDGSKTGKKGDWWWAKTVTKPSYEVNSNEYQLINHKFKYPGILTWQDINISIVDVGSKAANLVSSLGDLGYKKPTESSSGFEKKKATCSIKQYDADGKEIEIWTLQNAFIKSINFGDLDYSSDELVEIQLTVMYDWAELGGKVQTKASE